MKPLNHSTYPMFFDRSNSEYAAHSTSSLSMSRGASFSFEASGFGFSGSASGSFKMNRDEDFSQGQKALMNNEGEVVIAQAKYVRFCYYGAEKPDSTTVYQYGHIWPSNPFSRWLAWPELQNVFNLSVMSNCKFWHWQHCFSSVQMLHAQHRLSRVRQAEIHAQLCPGSDGHPHKRDQQCQRHCRAQNGHIQAIHAGIWHALCQKGGFGRLPALSEGLQQEE